MRKSAANEEAERREEKKQHLRNKKNKQTNKYFVKLNRKISYLIFFMRRRFSSLSAAIR